jgi:tripartite-type tricarboxylate transporter receptor subunit TctC
MRLAKLLWALATLSLAGGTAAAQDGAEFFKGKTLTYVVATEAGGGYDTYGRLVSKYLVKHLGMDKAIVRNMPGAGHIIGANFIYASKPDGLTIGTFNTGLIYAQLLEHDGVEFDLTKMGWVGKAAAETRTLVVGDHTEFITFDDVLKAERPIKLAVAGIGSASYTETQLLARAFGIDFQVIPGFSGTEDAMAIMREEVDGSFASRSSYLPFVQNGDGRFLLDVGGATYEGVPQARTLVKDDVGEAIVAVIESQATLARFTAGPPDIPADRLEALRNAYMAAMQDPELLAEAKKLDIPIEPMRGDEVAKAVSAALDRPDDVKAVIAEALNVEVPAETVEASLTGVEDEGRKIMFDKGGDTVTASISGSRTKIMIDGAEGKRDSLAVGMNCSVTYSPGGEQEASLVDCKK